MDHVSNGVMVWYPFVFEEVYLGAIEDGLSVAFFAVPPAIQNTFPNSWCWILSLVHPCLWCLLIKTLPLSLSRLWYNLHTILEWSALFLISVFWIPNHPLFFGLVIVSQFNKWIIFFSLIDPIWNFFGFCWEYESLYWGFWCIAWCERVCFQGMTW